MAAGVTFPLDLSRAPLRGSLVNLSTGELQTFPLNPTVLEERIQSIYQEVEILGMSHTPLQFKITGATQIPVEFYVSRIQRAKRTGQAVEDTVILDFKRYLQALTVPVRGAADVIGGAPPRVLFIWPFVITMTCVVRNIVFAYRRFDSLGDPLVYTARVDFTEARDLRITSEQVREVGSVRPPGGL